MSQTVSVSIECLAPHENAPEFIKGTTTFILSNDGFRKIEEYKRACNGNDKEDFIPIQIKETKSGKNMLFLDTYNLDYKIKKLKENQNNNNSEVSIDEVPF